MGTRSPTMKRYKKKNLNKSHATGLENNLFRWKNRGKRNMSNVFKNFETLVFCMSDLLEHLDTIAVDR
jgi:hypothetical protein